MFLNFPLRKKSEKKNPYGFLTIHYVNVKNEGEEIKIKGKQTFLNFELSIRRVLELGNGKMVK